MKKITIVLSSVTYSVKLSRLLKRAKISYRLVKIDNSKYGVGCSHGVEIYESDFLSVVMIMKENGIMYSILGELNDIP